MYMSTARTMAPGKQRPWATTPAATCVRKTPRRGPSGRRVHPSQTCQRARGTTWAKKNAHVLLTLLLLHFLLLLLLLLLLLPLLLLPPVVWRVVSRFILEVTRVALEDPRVDLLQLLISGTESLRRGERNRVVPATKVIATPSAKDRHSRERLRNYAWRP
mgnify:CR=1 FL=1